MKMGITEFTIVLFLSVTLWSNSADAAIDCRKFVFAPTCRGVSVKRSSHQLFDPFPKINSDDEQNVSDNSEDVIEYAPNDYVPILPLPLALKRFNNDMANKRIYFLRTPSMNFRRKRRDKHMVMRGVESNDDVDFWR